MISETSRRTAEALKVLEVVVEVDKWVAVEGEAVVSAVR